MIENKATPWKSLVDRAEEFGETTVELFRLQAIDKSADVVSSLASRLAILLVVALFIIVLSIGLALWAGELLGKSYYGFFAVGGVYILLALLLMGFRRPWLKKPVSNSIIKQMLKQKQYETE
jgi:O-antigen/teichoic acid export membrane protein